MDTTTQYEQEAFQAGVRAAKNAASWACDGNTKSEHVRRVLTMLEDGDPAVYDYLPAYPDLSGQWADDPTARSLAQEITGEEEPSGDVVDAIAEAWERGVSETFESECEKELRKWLGAVD